MSAIACESPTTARSPIFGQAARPFPKIIRFQYVYSHGESSRVLRVPDNIELHPGLRKPRTKCRKQNRIRSLLKMAIMPSSSSVPARSACRGCDTGTPTKYRSRDDHTPRGSRGIPRWQEAIFAAMARNSVRITDVLKLPHNQVVEIGREVAI